MTDNEIPIRAATLSDAPAIHEIYSFHVRYGTASWELEPPTLEEFQTRMTNILAQKYPYFVAELDETVVGYTFAGSFRPRPGYRYTVENSVYVHPQYQRRGLGRLLLAHLIKVCGELGYRQMVAVIGDSENTPSIRLHQKLGFVHIGTFSGIGFKHGRWLDSVLMQRGLATAISVRSMVSMATNDPFRRIVWPLAIAETLIWAATYYSFPALLLEWERDLGWSKTELSGAFTLALIVSAVLAPVVGRVIDRGYATYVFTGCATLSAVLLVLLSGVTAVWQFYAVWIMLGVAMAGSLYEATFVMLTRAMGSRRKQAITLVTLVAGFAGTVAFPGTHALVGLVGWRGTVRVSAVIVSLIVVPLIWFACRSAARYGESQAAPASHRAAEAFHIMRGATFWLLAVGFIAIALDHGVLLTHLLPLLDERGIQSGVAIFAASMIGPMQVTGRLVMLAVERHVSTLFIFAGCFVAMGIAAISLLNSHAIPFLLASFVLFQGAGYGATSIMRPVVIAELLGYKNFGLIAGLLAVPFLGAAAAAPTVAAFIWQAGGYDTVIWFAGGVSMLGLVSLFGAAILSTGTGD